MNGPKLVKYGVILLLWGTFLASGVTVTVTIDYSEQGESK